jgi:hypothetical protein
LLAFASHEKQAIRSQAERLLGKDWPPAAGQVEMVDPPLQRRRSRVRDSSSRLACEGATSDTQSDFGQRVHRTAHATAADFEHVGVDHRGRDIGVTQQLLHVRMSYPDCKRAVANECLMVWGVAGLLMPAASKARLNARWNV